MTTFLLDANALIAASVVEHEHHVRANTWLAEITSFAVSPIPEGALIRFLLRMGESAQTAHALVTTIGADPRAEFWADDVSFREVPLDGVRGHRQVTDAYLAALAQRHGGLLATFDEGLAELRPRSTFLIPPV
ncbi:MAG TPA: PIN domain-containing protein [Intrasporangiaceae bacterium]|nr:PIN domain-containing protein [Intrasporangiaceae bacterium]